MSFRIESVSWKDFSALRDLALKRPLLNLPAEEELLKKKVLDSESAFADKRPGEDKNFLFVLKELKGGRLAGSAQISSKSGTKKSPSYSLKMFEEGGQKFLQLRKTQDGPSYLGGLIVDKKHRGHPDRAGTQISLIRLLFCALHPEFFEDHLHAEVAPFLDEEGKSPFFEHFIRPRFSFSSMEEVDYLTLTDKEKLFAGYPREKISFTCLPAPVQNHLGKPGSLSQKAAGLLERQGFVFVDEVDPFDAGPYLRAKIKNIPLVKNSRKVFLAAFKPAGAFAPPPASPEKENGKTASPQSLKASARFRIKPGKTALRKWLWAKMSGAGFKGGLLEGSLQEEDHRLFVPEKFLKSFHLSSGERVFVSPFPAPRKEGKSL